MRIDGKSSTSSCALAGLDELEGRLHNLEMLVAKLVADLVVLKELADPPKKPEPMKPAPKKPAPPKKAPAKKAPAKKTTTKKK
jgi:hypothetical protein